MKKNYKMKKKDKKRRKTQKINQKKKNLEDEDEAFYLWEY